jgi:hypothetical protein
MGACGLWLVGDGPENGACWPASCVLPSRTAGPVAVAARGSNGICI